jgi:hypothetical protein
VVLSWRSGWLGVLVLAGCSESLFGVERDGPTGGGPDAGDPSGRCTGTCISNAAGSFDGSATGADSHWRYLEDTRDRFWTAMGGGGATMTGQDPDNRITSCAANPGAPACRMLPGALLVSAAGTDSPADPALAFLAPISQGIELTLRVAVPDGDDPTIRLYRNSREDALFTAVARAGAVLEQTIPLDALAGDRFLLAVAPTTSAGARDVGVDLTVRAVGAFPSTCQFAFALELLMGNGTVDLACSREPLIMFDVGGPPIVQGPGPFVEQGNALRISPGTYLALSSTTAIAYAPAVTVQFWVSQRAPSATAAWLFSDRDAVAGGGMGVAILPGAPAMLDVTTGRDPAPSFVHAAVAYPEPGRWHLLRLVRTRSDLQLCIDGNHAATIEAPAPSAGSDTPTFGKDVQEPAALAALEGSVDDIRVITGALPCAPSP